MTRSDIFGALLALVVPLGFYWGTTMIAPFRPPVRAGERRLAWLVKHLWVLLIAGGIALSAAHLSFVAGAIPSAFAFGLVALLLFVATQTVGIISANRYLAHKRKSRSRRP